MAITQKHIDQALIDRVFFHFVLNGDPAEAERSQVLDKLREDLEGKKYLSERGFSCFGTRVFLTTLK